MGSSPSFQAEMTRAQALSALRFAFTELYPESAMLDSRQLLSAATRVSVLNLVNDPYVNIGAEAAARLQDFAKRRLAHEPVSRILGMREFWSLDLNISPKVLDPRADTETLVQAVVEAFEVRSAPRSFLDLGTGSGAILCALLSEFTHTYGFGVDRSFDACAMAAANLGRLGLDSRASIVRGIWGRDLHTSFDLVVSNPPYITRDEMLVLGPEVSGYDPHLALFGGVDGLDCYRAICVDLPRLLNPRGVVAFEIGMAQARAVADLLRQSGCVEIAVLKDLAGLDRVVLARKP